MINASRRSLKYGTPMVWILKKTTSLQASRDDPVSAYGIAHLQILMGGIYSASPPPPSQINTNIFLQYFKVPALSFGMQPQSSILFVFLHIFIKKNR